MVTLKAVRILTGHQLGRSLHYRTLAFPLRTFRNFRNAKRQRAGIISKLAIAGVVERILQISPEISETVTEEIIHFQFIISFASLIACHFAAKQRLNQRSPQLTLRWRTRGRIPRRDPSFEKLSCAEEFAGFQILSVTAFPGFKKSVRCVASHATGVL